MATIDNYQIDEIKKANPLFSAIRTTVETAFYANNVTKVTSVMQAYEIAKKTTGTIITDLPIYRPTEQGLPEDSKVLVFNDGEVVGRTSAARKIIGQPGVDTDHFARLVREAVFAIGQREVYTTEVYVGLDQEFMLKSHLLLPANYANTILSYMLNFQHLTPDYQEMYAQSKSYQTGDLYVFGDPDWQHPDYPDGLALFDPQHNVAVILGLRYFGEYKKATLTLAWRTAHVNDYIACHGGMKQYILPNGNKFTMAAFGLSGSGKSTITLAKNESKYQVTVLHDDAFIINHRDGSSIALEPAYFDKTQDYPMANEKVKYFLTCQNIGVTLDTSGKKVLVTEDIRNGNGRAVKSKFVTPNRVNRIKEKINAVYWIMQDESLPPVVKVNDPNLAAIFGLTLATKRSTAENIVGDVDVNEIVIEPFANPFRSYALGEDFEAFKKLFEDKDIDCYILNTGYFNGAKVKPQHTLGAIEAIIDGIGNFVPFGPIEGLSYLPIEHLNPDFEHEGYVSSLKASMTERLRFIEAKKIELGGYHSLPLGTEEALKKILVALG
ncbi:MAG: phosphoenolpyruvate carboxykinase (ATP) [Streptococcaceae bacterium]|jgi:phosphoenolpyruvate carboxykinase (ATP)|nr:phosphoenolpyruvate carboxykinase (ATP) [Streptococcaceae bacterium]